MHYEPSIIPKCQGYCHTIPVFKETQVFDCYVFNNNIRYYLKPLVHSYFVKIKFFKTS